LTHALLLIAWQRMVKIPPSIAMTVSANRMAVCGADPVSERPGDEAGGWRLMAG